MKKVVVSIGCAGILAGVVLAFKKFDSSRTKKFIDCPLEIVREKTEHISENISTAPIFRQVIHSPLADESERKEKLQEAHDAIAAVLAAKQDDDVPENVNYAEDIENDERAFTLGTKEGNLVPFSDEYKAVIYSAYKMSLKDKNFTLKFYGSTYGIGTKGSDSDDGGKVFAKDDIAKLKKKLEK